MTEVVWTFRRPWLFPCPFSIPLLSLGCLPSPYRSSLPHHCYLVKLKERPTVQKSGQTLHESSHSSWLLALICCRTLCCCFLWSVAVLLAMAAGCWTLDCVCMCVFIGKKNTVLDVTLCWVIPSCSFLSVYNKTCSFGFPCWICQVHTRHDGFFFYILTLNAYF